MPRSGTGLRVVYDAFISYSQKGDSELATALQAGLQRFGRRWNQRHALRVFRDSTGLTPNPGMWSSIRDRLDEADWLILLCSPEAAASRW